MTITLFLIGYEVADIDKLNIFVSDIAVQMYNLGLLQDAIHDDESYRERLRIFLSGVLWGGILLGQDPDSAPDSTSGPDILDQRSPVRDFIKGLDPRGI